MLIKSFQFYIKSKPIENSKRFKHWIMPVLTETNLTNRLLEWFNETIVNSLTIGLRYIKIPRFFSNLFKIKRDGHVYNLIDYYGNDFSFLGELYYIRLAHRYFVRETCYYLEPLTISQIEKKFKKGFPDGLKGAIDAVREWEKSDEEYIKEEQRKGTDCTEANCGGISGSEEGKETEKDNSPIGRRPGESSL